VIWDESSLSMRLFRLVLRRMIFSLKVTCSLAADMAACCDHFRRLYTGMSSDLRFYVVATSVTSVKSETGGKEGRQGKKHPRYSISTLTASHGPVWNRSRNSPLKGAEYSGRLSASTRGPIARTGRREFGSESNKPRKPEDHGNDFDSRNAIDVGVTRREDGNDGEIGQGDD
jgi:hypothetical protein